MTRLAKASKLYQKSSVEHFLRFILSFGAWATMVVHCLGCPKRVNLWYSKFARVLRCVEAAQLSRSCFGIFNTVFFCLSVIAASTCRCRFCTSAFISLHLPSPLSRFKPPGVLANGTASTVFLIRPMAPEHQLPWGLMATFAVSSSELCRR